jgi:hypothetical protein
VHFLEREHPRYATQAEAESRGRERSQSMVEGSAAVGWRGVGARFAHLGGANDNKFSDMPPAILV